MQMWRAYLATLGETPESFSGQLSSWHFTDNPADADELVELVKRGRKTATSPSLAYFESRGEPLPRPGDLHVVTNWAGEAQCVIRTTDVSIVPFGDITAEYAAIEGEGDGSLAYWREVHWRYYQRELAAFGRAPTQDMPIVCERFEVVFPEGA